jgi:hypothetical protein
MTYKKRTWSKSDIINANFRNKEYIEKTAARLIRYYADERKSERKTKKLCRSCFYVDTGRIGGSAITTVICSAEGCDKEMTFGNTCTDIFCDECAEKQKLCKHCGAKMD